MPLYYLALCAIVKNEDHFLEEWLAYHTLIGVEHFYIYDNESANPLHLNPSLKNYRDAGRLTIIDMPGQGRQMPSYTHCLEHFGPLCRWIGFIDLDEFVCLRQFGDLRAFLAEFEPYAALALNWKLFGSNGHIARPEGLVLDNYTERLLMPKMELHIKSLVNPALAIKIKNPHTFFYRQNAYCVTERHLPVPAEEAFAISTRERAWINHYFYRSQQDFSEKVSRGRGSVTPDQGGYKYDIFYAQGDYPSVKEEHIRRFSGKVTASMRDGVIPLFMPEPEQPDDPQSHIDLATSYVLRQELEKAEITLCRAVLRFENNPYIWLARAFVARHKGEFLKAEKFIHKSLSQAELPQTWRELAILHLEQNKKEEAGDIIFYLINTPAIRVQDKNFYAELEAMALRHNLV